MNKELLVPGAFTSVSEITIPVESDLAAHSTATDLSKAERELFAASFALCERTPEAFARYEAAKARLDALQSEAPSL